MNPSLRRLTRVTVLVLATGLIFALPIHATKHQITVSNNQFSPNSKAIAHGDTVEWVLQSGIHTTTSDLASAKDWDSGNLQFGVPFRLQFTAADGPGPFPYHCENHFGMNGTITIINLAVELDQTDALPTSFSLDQNFPNPFNPTTTIGFSLERSSPVSFEVYNLLGELVESKEFGNLAAGNYSVNWDANAVSGSALPSGIYFYRLRAGELVETRKMVLLK